MVLVGVWTKLLKVARKQPLDYVDHMDGFAPNDDVACFRQCNQREVVTMKILSSK